MELPGEVQNLCRATTESSLRGSKWPNIEVQSRLIRGDLKVIKCGFLLHLAVTSIHGLGAELNIRQTRDSTDPYWPFCAKIH